MEKDSEMTRVRNERIFIVLRDSLRWMDDMSWTMLNVELVFATAALRKLSNQKLKNELQQSEQ